MGGSCCRVTQCGMCVALAREVLPGPSLSAPHQENMKGGEGSSKRGIPLRDFFLSRHETKNSDTSLTK